MLRHDNIICIECYKNTCQKSLVNQQV
jgi:hypothetical protein